MRLPCLTNDGATDWGASYTPDGGRIVFTSDRDGDNELYVMDANGGSPTQLTFNGSRDELPVWRGAASSVDHWMVVTNMGGSVAVGPGLTPIVPGQQIRIAMDRTEQPLRYEAPSTARMTYASPAVQALRDTMLPGVNDSSLY